jgi:hypothetical protein
MMEPANIQDEGLSLILSSQKELLINQDIIESLMRVLTRVAVSKPREHEALPEVD